MSGVVILHKMFSMLFCLFILISPVSAQYPLEKPSVNSGYDVYRMSCAACHGGKGDGSGMNGASDFTNSEIMIVRNSTLLFTTVTNGVPGKAMPSFGNLSLSKRWDVVAYIWTFWADRTGVDNGKDIFNKNCTSCHGEKGDGSGLPGAFDFTNLSRMAYVQPAVFFKSVSEGVAETAMPPWKDSLAQGGRWNAVKYLWTFQFRDYPPQATSQAAVDPSPSIEIPKDNEWYMTSGGAVIILISIAIAAWTIYLFGRGLLER
ncbi:MAG: cytochrome c [Candidatus Methanoperedens sp.]|nr:cytochrome c [Candidatus Methanoperedens sp.]